MYVKRNPEYLVVVLGMKFSRFMQLNKRAATRIINQ